MRRIDGLGITAEVLENPCNDCRRVKETLPPNATSPSSAPLTAVDLETISLTIALTIALTL
jgi:hypothetical protein